MTSPLLKPVAFSIALLLLGNSAAQAGHGCSRRGSSYNHSNVVYHSPVVVHPTAVVKKVIVETPVVVKPVVVKPSLLKVEQGSSLRIKVNFLGSEPGVVFMKAGKLTLQCQIIEWTPSFVVFQLPELGVLSPTEVTLDVAKADGTVARSTDVLLTPTPDIEVFSPVEVLPRAPRKISGNRPQLNTGGIQVAGS